LYCKNYLVGTLTSACLTHHHISLTKTKQRKMKKVCIAAGMLCLLGACNTPQTASNDQSMAQKNLDAVHIVNKAFETGDVSHIDEAVAADFVDHTDMGDKGRDSLKAMIVQMHKSGMVMKMETMKEVADNDYVFEMMRYSGTGDGVMAPAGPYDMRAVEVVRFKDGKGVEHWSYMDAADIKKMMSHGPAAPGAAVATAPPAKGDTVKHK
jgi:predicted SnoaL-like aldol condensation-catalyzing enzyme